MATASPGTDDTESRKPISGHNSSTSPLQSPRIPKTASREALRNAPDGIETPASAEAASAELAEARDNGNNATDTPSTTLSGAPSMPHKSRTMPAETDSQENTAIDPLSQHILKRTQTERSISYKLKSQTSQGQDSLGDGTKPNSTDQAGQRTETFAGAPRPKDKKKGVSFLSRIIGTKKTQSVIEPSDSNNISPNASTEETTQKNHVFAHPIGFIPRFPPPPRYLKVKAHFRGPKSFERVFLAQELEAGVAGPSADGEKPDSSAKEKNKAIWAMMFSKDGKYLAAAGQDKVVRVWAVITNAADREAHEQEEDEMKGTQGMRLTAPVFKTKPVREYYGHTGSVLDLSWSKNNFLLSSSMDRTVRLWHVSRAECLCCFKHSDFVTSIQFHPRDDRFFLAGSLDMKLRLWSIPDKSVAFWATVSAMITSVAFTPDGKHSIAGCLNGLCIIYETDGLKASAQLHVRSARGRNAKGSKITGIDTIMNPPNDPNGDIKMLITSNDSRIRMYNFKDRNLEAKYRGNENSTSQIRATFSEDGKYIICGSEDGHTYIWPTASTEKDPEKRALEELDMRTDIVTCSIMAPICTKQLLGFSGDPLYDLCNPPPITLVSQVDSAKSSRKSDDKGDDQQNQRKDPDSTPTTTTKANISPTYLARSVHPNGNIILSADCWGHIKVYRQDCAHNKRFSDWDVTSTFSKKLLGRSNSARHSIASSIGRESKTPSERILAWRSSVAGTELASIDSPTNGSSRTRTPSPRKFGLRRRSLYSSPVNSPDTKTQSGYVTPITRSIVDEPETIDSGRPSKDGNTNKADDDDDAVKSTSDSGSGSTYTSEDSAPGDDEKQKDNRETTVLPEIPQFSETNQSNAFWTRSAEFVRSFRSQRLLTPNYGTVGDDTEAMRRKSSVPSALSSDFSSAYDSPHEGTEADESDVLRCPKCRGKSFRATIAKGGKQKLVCVRCNNTLE